MLLHVFYRWFFVLCTLLLLIAPAHAASLSSTTNLSSSTTSSSTTNPSITTSQPWLVNSNSFAMVAFSLEPGVVKRYLPSGLQPLINDKGKVNANLEVYSTERIAGLAPYKIAFLIVEVANQPSRAGIPGHFAIWGRVDTKSSLDFFTREFGFPYKLASRLDIQHSADTYKAVIGDELQLQIEPLRDKPFDGSGVVDMLSVHSSDGLVKTEVPFLTTARFGNVVSLVIESKGDSLLNLLKNTKPDWSLVSEQQIFTYSQRISLRN